MVKEDGEDYERWGCLESIENSVLTCGTPPSGKAVVECCGTTFCNRNSTPTYPPVVIDPNMGMYTSGATACNLLTER